MNKKELFTFYEKLYFKEFETKEFISNRIQIPFGIHFSILTYYGYLLRNTSFGIENTWLMFFNTALLISFFSFIMSAYHLRNAFTGFQYQAIPTTNLVEEHRKHLKDTYKETENSIPSEEEIEIVLFDYFCEYSTNNANINDARADHLYDSNQWLTINVIPIIITFLVFCFSGVAINK